MQSLSMETNQAAENLQVIRTLMERSALYRRALAPIMLLAGLVGAVGAVVGIGLHIDALRSFGAYWLGVAATVVVLALFITRRQALKDSEPFWSPPTRRVAQALAPPLAAGLMFSLIVMLLNPGPQRWLLIFPNVLFYGCALHAAGFFTTRGVRLFAWILIVLGNLSCVLVPQFITDPSPAVDHALMGMFFGGLHLAYGAYLYITEQRKNAA